MIYTPNYAVRVALGQQSMHVQCTVRKLSFLHRIIESNDSIFSTLSDDVESLCKYMTAILPLRFYILRDMGSSLYKRYGKDDYVKDCILTLQKTSHFNVLVDVSNTVGWREVWDLALDFGSAYIQSIRNLVTSLTADVLAHANRKYNYIYYEYSYHYISLYINK